MQIYSAIPDFSEVLFWKTNLPMTPDLHAAQGRASTAAYQTCCLLAARELQADGEAGRRRPPAVQRVGQLLPGEGQDREELRPAAGWLGQEVEGRGGER